MGRVWAWALAAPALTIAWLTPCPGYGQTQPVAELPAPRHFGGQRKFGVGPTVGFATGAGGLAGVVLPPVGLWVSGGYMPLFVFGNEHEASRTLTFNAYSSAQLSADLSILPWRPNDRVDIGLVLGYRYNTVLAHGVGGGFAVTYDLSKAIGLLLTFEYTVFPEAQGQLAGVGYPTDRDASLPWLQGGANVGLVLYP
jgi:hypothetical protein